MLPREMIRDLLPPMCFARGSAGNKARETGRPYEELPRERVQETEDFFKRYKGDGSIADILRFRYKERAAEH
jgi:hypothetical protein